MKSRLNPARLIEIANGVTGPSTPCERLFYDCYQQAIEGFELMEILIQIKDQLDNWTVNEYDSAMLGYAYGQARLRQYIDLNKNAGKGSAINH